MNVRRIHRAVIVAVVAASALQLGAIPRSSQAAPSSAKSVQVTEINNQYAFRPAKIVIKPGTKVTWINKSNAPHTVTGTKGWSYSSKMFTEGHEVSVTFKKAGTFHYICSIHPYMKGTVVVHG